MALLAGSCRRTATLTTSIAVILAVMFLALQIDLPWDSLGAREYVSRLELRGGALRIRAFTDNGKLARARDAALDQPVHVEAPGPASTQSSIKAAPPTRPPGFEQWMRFAEEHKCVLEPYERISRGFGTICRRDQP